MLLPLLVAAGLLVVSLLSFGLSTAIMFAVMSRLVKSRLRVQLGHTGETEEPMRSMGS